MPDRERKGNSRTGSVYIVKPKMHGPEEVSFACDVFTTVEGLWDCQKIQSKLVLWMKNGVQQLNLKECIRAAASRVVFINTGFLDRTGDEIHTSMEAGPMIRKADMKRAAWISLMRMECRYRATLWVFWRCANRQRHVGHARYDGRNDVAENQPSTVRGKLCMGTLTHSGYATCPALPSS